MNRSLVATALRTSTAPVILGLGALYATLGLVAEAHPVVFVLAAVFAISAGAVFALDYIEARDRAETARSTADYRADLAARMEAHRAAMAEIKARPDVLDRIEGLTDEALRLTR